MNCKTFIIILLSILLSGFAGNISAQQEIILEAEDAVLNGLEIAYDAFGFSGAGYVRGFDKDSDSLVFEFQIEKKGFYELIIGYYTPHGKKGYEIVINGTKGNGMLLDSDKKFAEHQAGKTKLVKGKNTISILKGWGWFDIDYIKLKSATFSKLKKPGKSLVDPKATPEAKALMSYLVDNYGKKTLSGQQGYKHLEYIKEQTGKEPAIIGFDFMDYSPSRIEFGAKCTETKDIIEWTKSGGIATISWHWNAPKDLINEVGGKEWWSGFYTRATTFDVSKAMNDKESEEYKLIIRDIDAIAKELKTLQSKGIPLLWRPLHESAGTWFWWGAKGAKPLVWLWRLLFDRLVNHHEIHNLIWVFTTTVNKDEWYPGDEYVDIAGIDIYTSHGDPMSGRWDALQEAYGGNKLITLFENGPTISPDLSAEFQIWWSWFCTWGNLIRKVPVEDLKKCYYHESIITKDELPEKF